MAGHSSLGQAVVLNREHKKAQFKNLILKVQRQTRTTINSREDNIKRTSYGHTEKKVRSDILNDPQKKFSDLR